MLYLMHESGEARRAGSLDTPRCSWYKSRIVEYRYLWEVAECSIKADSGIVTCF